MIDSGRDGFMLEVYCETYRLSIAGPKMRWPKELESRAGELELSSHDQFKKNRQLEKK
jgi:hypothetical protein